MEIEIKVELVLSIHVDGQDQAEENKVREARAIAGKQASNAFTKAGFTVTETMAQFERYVDDEYEELT